MKSSSDYIFCRLAYLAVCIPFLAAGIFLSSCRGVPDAQEPPLLPLPSLVFDGVHADNPDNLTLRFTLEIENPLPHAGRVTIESWLAEVNGQMAASGFALEEAEDCFPIGAGASASFALTLNMYVPDLIAQGLAPADDYAINLITRLRFIEDSEAERDSPAEIQVSGLATFPGVRPPMFSITSIAILKAELINTRFRVGMRIDNPNAYPVELSSFGYTLYGNDRLWAEGNERNVITIPAKSSVEGNLFLLMNFMGMRRTLLDQIIHLVDVSYRFTGEARVATGVDFLPTFTTRFELSGFSQVLDE